MKTCSLLALACALWVALAGSAQAAPTARLCDPSRTVTLDVGAAARLPVDAGRPLGATAARQTATTLAGSTNFCRAPLPRWLSRELARVRTLGHRGQRAAVSHALAAMRRRVARVRTPQARGLARIAAVTECRIGAGPTVRPDGKTQQFVEIAELAQLLGDDDAADAAMADAKRSYRQWADSSQGESVGDLVAIASGAFMLGLDDVAEAALARAARRAAADAARQQSQDADPCVADPSTMRCALKAAVIAELLGVEGATSTADLARMSKAVADRAAGDLPEQCERWIFDMRITQRADGKGLLEDWVLSWSQARIDLNRETGALTGARTDGAEDWALSVGSPRGRCLEETPEGTIDHGPGDIVGGLFHYRITGNATPDAIALELQSPDARVATRFQGDHQMCLALAGMTELIGSALLTEPLPITVATPPGETLVELVDDDGASRTEIRLHRVR